MNCVCLDKALSTGLTKRSHGFTLLEALIALVLVSTGLLALAGMQSGLARNAESSRQRSEAVRLAQEQLEKIRSYSQIAAVMGAFNWNNFGWDSLVDGGDSPGDRTNTTYTRVWSIGGVTTDSLRPVSVSVGWNDRTGQAQSVVLSSVVSENDPAFSASVGFSMAQSNNLKQPKNRNLNIPMPAISLGSGQSSYQIAENYALVFDDSTGFVVKQCNDTVSISTDLSTCSNLIGYIVTGYISKTSAAMWPNGVNLEDLNNRGVIVASSKCKFGAATDQATGTALSDFYFYVCVLPVPNGGDPWAGTVRLSGVPGGSTVCRFEYPLSIFANSNERNVQPYANVRQSLDNQNYIVFKNTANNSTDACPTASATGGLQTTLHQDCRTSNASRATDCPTTSFPAPN